VAKAVSDSAIQRQLEELRRHNRAMKSRGQYLAPYKYGEDYIPYKRRQGVITKKRNAKKTLKIPTSAITNIQLGQLARRMHALYFKSVFMRNALLISGAHRNKSGKHGRCEES